MEEGHKNAGDALRMYNSIKERLPGSDKVLSGLAFASKASSLPMAAADLFAYTAYGQETGARPWGESKYPLKADASYKGNLFRVPITRDVLDSLHAQALAGRSHPIA